MAIMLHMVILFCLITDLSKKYSLYEIYGEAVSLQSLYMILFYFIYHQHEPYKLNEPPKYICDACNARFNALAEHVFIL